ncbi:MAG: RNA-binding S4 domain-containing protein [Candidatus Sericytochromatia bacterium]|nr:RNA-binding S4 domain-containing protein [Candidatus Sericytochromatia bacterium]
MACKQASPLASLLPVGHHAAGGATGSRGADRRVRLDKWLKVSRLVKRRTVADTLCDLGRVMVEGRIAKSATPVRPGQRLLVRWGHRMTEVQILEVPSGNVPAAEASRLYRLIDGVSPEVGEAEHDIPAVPMENA